MASQGGIPALRIPIRGRHRRHPELKLAAPAKDGESSHGIGDSAASAPGCEEDLGLGVRGEHRPVISGQDDDREKDGEADEDAALPVHQLGQEAGGRVSRCSIDGGGDNLTRPPRPLAPNGLDELDDLKRNWNEPGRTVDPLWAIFAYPEYRHGNRWTVGVLRPARPRSRLIRGRWTLGASPGRDNERALDFGCGAGRLTQALGRRFDRADGVDVAASMVDVADDAKIDPQPIVLPPQRALRPGRVRHGTFDLILSIVVFQHMSNRAEGRLPARVRAGVRTRRDRDVHRAQPRQPLPGGLLRRLPNPVQNVYRRRRYGYDAVIEVPHLPPASRRARARGGRRTGPRRAARGHRGPAIRLVRVRREQARGGPRARPHHRVPTPPTWPTRGRGWPRRRWSLA